MAIEWDPILFVNLVLCIIIVLLGLLCYQRNPEPLSVYIAVAFGLFGVSHTATLLGFKVPLTIPLIVIRTLAYILVIYALWSHLQTSLIIKEGQQAWVEYFKDELRQPSEDGNVPEQKK
jgi:hypothetical protein